MIVSNEFLLKQRFPIIVKGKHPWEERGDKSLKSSACTKEYQTMAQPKEVPSKSRTEAQLFEVIGDFGPWQRRTFIVLFMVNIIGVWQNFSLTFLAPNMDYKCVSTMPDNSSSFLNLTFITDSTDESRTNQCEVYVEDNSTMEGYSVQKCSKWEYNLTVYSNTLVSEWNLVCEREWLVSFAKSVYMIGFMVSVIVFGQISDCFGRYPTILTCYVITLVSSLLSPFSISYTMFAILRFLQAFGRTGLSTTGFVLLMEIVGPKWRTELGVAIQVGWPIGFVTLPAIAWFIRHWFWLQVALSIPIIPLACMLWIVPESPRWLMTRRKRKQFEKVILQAIKLNGREVKKDIKDLLPFEPIVGEKENKAKTIVDLVRTPNLRNYTINMMVSWAVNAYVYYSMSYNTNDLVGNPYFNFLMSGFMEVLSYALMFYVIRKLGRKSPLVVGMLIGGVSCALIMAVPSDLVWLSNTFAMIGKFCITGTFGILYIYTSELFPTVVRNVAIGSCSTCGRVGSIVAPFGRELGKATHPLVPNALNAILAIVSGLFGILLPETKDKDIPDTLEEAENQAERKEERGDPYTL